MIITNSNVLDYLNLEDIKNIVFATENNLLLEDIISLCHSTKGYIFKFFNINIRNNTLYIKKAIEVSKLGYTLLRYVSKENIHILWIYDDFSYSDYFEGLSYITKYKGNIPEKFKLMLIDYGFVFLCLRIDGCRLKYLDNTYRSNKFLVETAIMQNGNSLLYASNELRNDINIVKKCVLKFPWALEYVGKQSINNIEIIKSATFYVKWVNRYIL